MRLVLVDIDGTLVRPPATERRLFRFLAQRGALGWRQYAAYVAGLLLWWPRLGRDLLKKNKAYLTGLPVARVAELADEFVAALPGDDWNPAMVQRITRHLASGDTVVLLSGTPEFVAAAIAARLGVGECIATRCAERNGRFVFAPPPVHPWRESKLALARERAARDGVAADQITAYADSIHDAALLEWAGTAVAVSPDEGLAALAGRSGWEVLAG